MLESVGYATNTAKAKATEIIEQPGVQEELNRLGFTEENANAVVGTILMNPKEAAKDRLKAAELVYKVTGAFTPDIKDQSGTVNIFHNPQILVATQSYEDSLKALIAHESIRPVQTQATEVPEGQDIAIGQGAIHEGAG